MVRLHDIMSVRIKSLTPNMTLREAAEFLTTEHIGGAPVISGERVVGVASVTDVLDFVSSNPGPPRARLSFPLTARTASRTASASIRRAFCRQSSGQS